jgi:hypothetical protein
MVWVVMALPLILITITFVVVITVGVFGSESASERARRLIPELTAYAQVLRPSWHLVGRVGGRQVARGALEPPGQRARDGG